MKLFDILISRDDLKKYTGDFEVIEEKDPKGRTRKTIRYKGEWIILRSASAAEKARLWAALAAAFLLAGAYGWMLTLTHIGSGQYYVMVPLLAGLFPLLYLMMGVCSLPFRCKPMRRDQYMHSFIRSSRSAMAVAVFAAAGLLAVMIFRAVKGDWDFFPEDRLFMILCAAVIALAAGIIILLRKIDVTERENGYYPQGQVF